MRGWGGRKREEGEGVGWEERRGGMRGGRKRVKGGERRREEGERQGVGDKGERRREKGKEGKRGEGRMVLLLRRCTCVTYF